MTRPLEGWQVLTTRPEGRGGELARRLARAGARAVALPTLRIEALPPPEPNPVAQLAAGDWLIAVSPAAVEHGAPLLAQRPAGLRAAAVGPGTGQALQAAGVADAVMPATGGSEALLEKLPGAAVAGRRVLLLKGEGGRELLARVLERRGASIREVAVYRRVCPPAAPRDALRALDRGGIGAIVVTSAASLDNLLALTGPGRRPRLRATPLVVASPRLLNHARSRGFAARIVCAGASDEDLFEGVLALSRAPAPDTG